MTGAQVTVLVVAAVVAAALTSVLLHALRPLLVRYALARPNARSSHREPTPQGGGVAIVAVAALLGPATASGLGGAPNPAVLATLVGGMVGLALLGAVDDIRPLPALPRFLVQVAAVAALVWFAEGGRILPDVVPLALERGLLVLAGVWWVNLTNFMDGIDWITVAEFVPLSAVLAALSIFGVVGVTEGAMAAVLLGSLLGFAPLNRPVAKLFLGDVGSLPIGLLSGWLLLSLAGAGHLAAALLLPLYYLADATLTLLRRGLAGERVWEAHRSHFYQRATTNGLSVLQVDRRIAGLNLALAALAIATIAYPALSVPSLVVGAALVAVLLRRFGRDHTRSV